MQVRFLTDERGRTAVEKRAETAEEAARLRREADLLEVAAHPGLVELISVVDAPEPRLCTGRVVGSALVEVRGLAVEEVAGVVSALASTLADLHAMTLVHGAVTPEHVVLDEDGRPVLCSVGYGGLAGERPAFTPDLEPPFIDPARMSDEQLDPAADVYGLGALLGFLLGRSDGQNRRTADGLARLAERATAEQRADRPTARELADAAHNEVRGARLPRLMTSAPVPDAAGVKPAPSPQPLEGWRRGQVPRGAPTRGHPRRLMLLAVPVLAGAFVVLLLRSAGRDRPSLAVQAPGAPAQAESPTTTVAEEPPVRPTEPVRSGCAPVDAPMTADADRDGCAETVRFVEGVLETGGMRWVVGQPGDLAAVGDWYCAGSRSLALLRPATGEVFAFDRWAAAGQDLHAPALARVGGARSLRAADLDGDGCHELVVERATGGPSVLKARTVRP